MGDKTYSPSLLRVVGATFKDLGKRTVESIKCIGSFCKDAYESCADAHEDADYKRIVKNTIISNIAPYFLPTTFRKTDERWERERTENIPEYEFTKSPELFFGSLGWCAQFYVYMTICAGKGFQSAHPEIFLIPVATNVLSGIYEYGVHIKKQLIKKHEGKLETTINDSFENLSEQATENNHTT